jgi:hypothetical protein
MTERCSEREILDIHVVHAVQVLRCLCLDRISPRVTQKRLGFVPCDLSWVVVLPRPDEDSDAA